MDFFISSAHAQAAGAPPGAGMANLVMIGLLVVFFYFILLRPQMKRAKEHKALVEGLAKGDEVVTNGGVLGKIENVGDTFITLQIADSTQIKLQKHSVAAVMPKGTIRDA